MWIPVWMIPFLAVGIVTSAAIVSCFLIGLQMAIRDNWPPGY